MARRESVLVMALVLLIPVTFGVLLTASSEVTGASAVEIALYEWNGQNVIEMTEKLCRISSNHTAYRVSGSDGANEAADLIRDTFDDYGLTVSEEGFELPVWNMRSQATMLVDADGNMSTDSDSHFIASFNAESYSWPTADGGFIGEIVTLPLPAAASRADVGTLPIDSDAWNDVNTTGKALLIGREVRWAASWQYMFINKITHQTPKVVIFYQSYEWMNYTEQYSQASTGGRPLTTSGPFFWDLEIAHGSVNYSDGRSLVELAQNGALVTIEIDSEITEGTHRNIIADIPSSTGSSEMVLIGAHYDTVMCEGYADNTASVATMLEIARTIGSAMDAGKLETRYALRFVAFAGEELGLAGSLNYVDVHRDEVSNLVAVIVADCIGAGQFMVTDPNSGDHIDLNALVSDSATKLDVSIGTETLDSSDHVSFMYPQSIANNVNDYWGTDWDLQGVAGFSNSILFYSYPMTIYETTGAQYGQIHTQADSTSGIEGWISEDDLEAQARVIALTVLQATVIEEAGQELAWVIYLVPLVVAAVVIILLFHHFRGRE